jgi:excisionase family DNA binding protein
MEPLKKKRKLEKSMIEFELALDETTIEGADEISNEAVEAEQEPVKVFKEGDLLTIPEVAAVLRVDGTTVRRWVKNGLIAAVELPHANKRVSYRVRYEELLRILAQTH